MSVNQLLESVDLPDGWETFSLRDLLQPKGIAIGVMYPGAHDPDGVPVVRVKDMQNGRITTGDVLRVSVEVEQKHVGARLIGGEILLSLVGSVGRVAIVPPELSGWNTVRAVAVLRPGQAVSNVWLKLWLSSEPVQQFIKTRLNTTVQATLNLRDVREIPVIVPPKRERDAISAVLGALDDKIAVNEHIAASAMDLGKAKFQLLSSAANAEVTVGDVVELKYGKSLPVVRRIAGDVPVFGSGGISGTHCDALVKGPGIVVGRKGTVGAVYWSEVDFFPIDTTFYVACKNNKISLEYMYFALGALGLEHMNSDSAVPGLNRDRVQSLFLRIPEPDAMREFTGEARSLFQLQRSREEESRALASLRDTLLPQLMSGRLRVKDAEKIVEDHV
ncbi:restriction endonuclease subunit S [Streptomyces sp. NPDC005141]